MMLVTLIGCTISQSDGQGNEVAMPGISLTFTMTVIPISQSATSAPLLAPTQTASVISTPAVTPSRTTTITPSPSAMLTATFTPAPTLTPLPTIPLRQHGQVYADLMSSNGGCVLPCWWGFELGVTPLDEIRQFYAAFGTYITEQVGRNGISELDATFVDPQIENGEQVVHSFVGQDGVVITAQIHAHDPSYRIEPLLQQLGPPSEVWMWTIPEPYQGILIARFYLYFPEHGVFILYATGGESHRDTVNICFDDYGGVKILLWDPIIWDPDNTKGFTERLNESSERLAYKSYRSIEEVSDWSLAEFYTILTDSIHSECLETPSNLWPSP